MKRFDINKVTKDGISPQSFETNDGRVRIEIIDEDYFELTFYDVNMDDLRGEEDRQTLTFDSKDRDMIIRILQASKSINPYAWRTIEKKQESREL
jgi:hypothetical protein